MKPDVIVSWPVHADFPLWRQFIHAERERFDQVIVAFTDHPGYDYAAWIVSAMAADEVTFVPTHASGDRDWRDLAVNAALDLSDAEWVWFTEQDLIITDPYWFWGTVNRWSPVVDAVGIAEPGGRRAHPACLFVRREAVNATSRYFGTVPVDHFGAFADELGTIHYIPSSTYEHLQGLSHNHWLIDSGEEAGRFKMDRFARYLEDCLQVDVPLDSDWAERSSSYLRAQAA